MNRINIPYPLREKRTPLPKLRMPRKSEGRQRIEIVRITKQSNLSVAFSKRRFGIFKKASELCTLCAAQVAIIVFSQNQKKVYSFGSPSVEAIINCFLEQSPDPSSSRTSQFMDLLRNASIQELHTRLTNMLAQLQSEKKAGKELQKIRKESQRNYWWDKPIKDLGLANLEQLKMAMLEMKEFAQKQVEGHMVEAFGSTCVRGTDLSMM
ncbi:putative transcription factor MADS-type1 family [Helianthus anomalus]